PSVPGETRRRTALCGSESPGGQRHGQPLVASDRRLCESAALMQAHKHHLLFVVRPRMTRLQLHLYGRVTASLVALALCTPGWAAPRAPEQATPLPGLP